MENDKYFLDLVTHDVINYNGLIIYPPKFREIKNFGVDNYNSIMKVFSLSLECFEGIVIDNNTNLFNDFLLMDDFLLSCMNKSLFMITKADEIYFNKEEKYLELRFFEDKDEESTNKKYSSFIVNSSNFDDISDIVLKINSHKKLSVEKTPDNMSDRQRDIWLKLQEGRNRDKNKNEIHIYDVLNVCEFGGNYHIPNETICEWSLWCIMNCYKARIGIKTYDDNLNICLVTGGDSKSITGNNHWHQQLMIRE